MIENELKDLTRPYLAMLVVGTSDYLDASVQSAKVLTKSMPGVYVTVNRPYTKLLEVFKKNKIDVSKLIFIDAITAVAVSDIKDEENCIFIQHPSDMTNLGVAVLETLKAIPGEKFLLVDSISTLLSYNSAEKVTHFLHSLAGKLSVLKATGLFLALEGETEKLVEDVTSQFCDKIVELGKVQATGKK